VWDSSYTIPHFNYFQDGQQYKPLISLKKCIKPKLLFSGTDDEFYTPKEIQEIYGAVPEPKILHELDSEYDYRYHPEFIDEVNEIAGQFLDKYLPVF